MSSIDFPIIDFHRLFTSCHKYFSWLKFLIIVISMHFAGWIIQLVNNFLRQESIKRNILSNKKNCNTMLSTIIIVDFKPSTKSISAISNSMILPLFCFLSLIRPVLHQENTLVKTEMAEHHSFCKENSKTIKKISTAALVFTLFHLIAKSLFPISYVRACCWPSFWARDENAKKSGKSPTSSVIFSQITRKGKK